MLVIPSLSTAKLSGPTIWFSKSLFACLRWSLMDSGPTNSGRLLLECLQKNTVHNALTEGGHIYIYICMTVLFQFQKQVHGGLMDVATISPLPHHQYNGSSLAHFSYCMLPHSWSMHESSPQWKMQVLNTTMHMYTLKTFCMFATWIMSSCSWKYLNFSSMHGIEFWGCIMGMP